MTTSGSSSKLFIGIGIVLVLAALGYFMFKKPVEPEGGLLQEQKVALSTQANADSARILSLLKQIEKIEIDTTIFESAAYKSLWDFTVEIPERAVGRANPFAPLPGSAPVSTTSRPRSTR